MVEEKQGKKCKCCIFLGIVLIAAGLLADVIGLGASSIFGPKQIAAVVVGVLILLWGLSDKSGASNCCICNKDKSDKAQ